MDLSGAESFTYTVSDGTETATGSVSVTVNSLRDDPYFAEGPSPGSGTGAAVRREIAENSPIGSDVGAPVGALDPDGDTVTYSLGGPDSASFSIAATTGQIQSKETLDYEAQQNIYNVTVEVTDGIDANGNADPAVDTTLSVTIHVTDVNESPQAVNDTARIAEDANVVVDVLVNDTDPDAGAVLTVTAVSTPTHGSAVITGKSVTYAPSTDFSGQDQFTYTVSDGELFATATVTVTVTPVDDPPVAEDDTATTEEDTRVNIAVLENDSDVGTDSANLSVTINTTPANGAAAVRSDHSIDYTPQADYVGVDSFTYTLSDGTSEDHASVRITVNAVNDPPGFNEESTGSGDGGLENSDLVTRQVGGNSAAGANIGEPVPATDPDGDQLSYALDGTDRDAFSIDSNNGQLKTKASLDFETKSTYSVTVTVSDGKDQDGNPDGSVDASIDVKINVTDVNEAPIAADDRAVVAEDSSVNIDVLRNDTDPDANTNLAVTANTEPAHGTAVFNQDHSITYTPDADYNGADSFNYTVSDGAFTDTASVTLTVTPVEDSPRFQDQDGNDITGEETSRNVDENTPAGHNIGDPIAATDPDGQSLTFGLGNSEGDLAFSIDDTTGQLLTKASLDFETKASYQVTVTATDTASNSSSVTVDISVNDRNETPSFDESSPVTLSVDENVALATNVGAPVTATDQDAGPALSYSLLSSDDADAFSIDPDTGQISLDAALDRETQERYTFQVSASDGFLSAEIEVVVTILNVDEPPVAQDDSITTNEDTAVNIPVLENDTDVDTDRDNLVITIQDAPDHGTAAVQADQTVQYTPEAEYSGSDRFTYSVSDGTGSDEASVSVTIDDANDRPVFDEAPPQEGNGTPEGSAVTRAVAENTPAGQNIGEAISASDAEDDRLTYGFTGADSTQFDIDANTGQLKTKEPLNYEDKSSYTFEVTVSDGKDEDGNADPSIDSSISVTVTVTDANDAPVANDDSTNVDEDSSVVISVLANDADEDAGDTLHIVSTTDPSHGAITINDGGTLTYVPEANFNGADSFEYTLSDGGLSDTGLVQITVNPVQDSPDFEEDDPDGNGDGNSENLDDPVTREIAENTPSGENIGDPVTATDPDDDTLTYSLAGPDSASFSIDAGNGQLRTKDPLNYELKNSYSVTVVATDPDDNAASIDVTINVTDVNDTPTFT